MKPYATGLMIFRRDLRIEDNTALLTALQKSKTIIPLFIFDPTQQEQNNSFFSAPAFTFMIESLIDLEQTLQKHDLQLWHTIGNPSKVVEKLLRLGIYDAVFFNADYTPFSKTRDAQIATICTNYKIPLHITHDSLLLGDPESIRTKTNTPYKQFSAFFTQACLRAPAMPKKTDLTHITQPNLKKNNILLPFNNSVAKTLLTKQPNTNPALHGGTTQGLALLKKISQLKDYKDTRNIPAKTTSLLSAHNKFGTLSIRTIYHEIIKQFGPTHELIRQLYWRDFFTYMLYHYPETLTESARPQHEPTTWNSSEATFKSWCEGNTGIPIIDAGIRQLNKTGYMHNRARMLTASYLVKNLLVDWRKGAQYFAQKLIDYDPAVNAGNWQWISSTGYDAQPPFRRFNPATQTKTWDPDHHYIQEWL